MAWKPAYVTVAEAKEYLRIPAGDVADDVRLGLDVEAASRAIDRATKRQFGQDAAPVARRYTAEYDHTICKWIVRIDDLQDVDPLTVASDGTAITDYELWPFNAVPDGRPYTEIRLGTAPATREPGGVTVTAQFGWTAVPATIKDATRLQAARFFKRSDAPFGVAGSPEAGSEMRLLAKVDPDVAVMVSDYVRRWMAA